ncbi:hypothetical protein D6C83_05244 [Aureobasidium pullulans]|uniref:Zn(2)-C6 fungal-type domain-containing protein n=1 Tax=Aureobasidium pullulans TaxID=5580 RepID=A0A4V4LHE1_AURPU|nr:hypothetical protein D6C83_05244 [Aureobasidium pullulans]
MESAHTKQSTTPTASGAVPLSCTLCRKRKIKCDKQNPCSNCVTAQKECVPVVRARLPRGRNGGRKGINAELRNRINRLEGLVQSLNSGLVPNGTSVEAETQKTQIESETRASSFSGPSTSRQPLHDSREATPDTTRWPLGSTLWTQLAHELNDIHAVLDNEDDDNDKDEEIDSSPPSMSADSGATPKDMLFTSQPATTLAPVVSDNDIVEYLRIFRRNVDYILKFVHMPSFEKLLTAKEPYLGHPADSPGTQALMASAFYACICSISNSHCLLAFNKTKEVLRTEWQQTTFQYLAKVEIVKTPSLVSLQALLLYILHREESYNSLPWGRAELRRRTWFTLKALDYQAAMDRGSDLAIVGDGWTTKVPTNCIDSDFALDARAPPPSSGPCTSMVFYAIHCHSNWLLRKLNWILPGEAERPATPIQSSWSARQEAITSLERTLDEDILSHIQGHDVFRFACISFTKVLIRCAQLYAVRPLQRHPDLTLPPPEHLNILLLAVEALEVKRGLLSETTEPWHWVIKGFVDWHGLAVLLAELCNPDQYDAQSLERAWNIALVSFDELSGQIAEGVQGPLWRPIKKLMRIAQKKRQERLVPPTTTLPGPTGNGLDDLSAYTTSAMGLMAMNSTVDINQGWNPAPLDPLQGSWFNWQSFTDDLTLNNGYGWGSMDFDPVFESMLPKDSRTMIDSVQGHGANAAGNGYYGGISKILEMEAKLTSAQMVEYKKTTTLAEATAYMKGIFGDGMTADPSSNKARKKRNNKETESPKTIFPWQRQHMRRRREKR